MKIKAFIIFVAVFFFLPSLGRAETFTVNAFLDTVAEGYCASPGSICTLRAAIQRANTLSGEDEIILPDGTYTLTSEAGHLIISGDLKIRAQNNGSAIIDANNASRVFVIDSGNVELVGLKIQKGESFSSPGGGILMTSVGTLRLTDCVVTENRSSSNSGGGITLSNGTVILERTSVVKNSAFGSGGGIQTLGTSPKTLTLLRSFVIDNEAIGGSGGGIFSYLASTVTLTESTVEINRSHSSGGGIKNLGTMTLIRSTVSGNTTEGTGGGIDNWSNGTVKLTNSTVSGNSAFVSGGIYNTAGAIYLNNSTIYNNTATSSSASVSGGIFDAIAPGGVRLENSIVAGNLPRDCSGNVFTGGRYNLIQRHDSCTISPIDGIPGNIFDTDPLLSPLADNGGPTKTHMPLPGSPVLDAGNPDGCTDDASVAITTDQRGFARPVNGRCDIGSVEVAASEMLPADDPSTGGVGSGAGDETLPPGGSETLPSSETAESEVGGGITSPPGGETIPPGGSETLPSSETAESEVGGGGGTTPPSGGNVEPEAGGAGGCSLIVRASHKAVPDED